MNHKPSISDEAILEATGRSWREWFGVMEASGMAGSSHEEIVTELREKHGVPAWWQQSITEAFEQFIGRREKGGADDGFHTSVSRTIDASASRIHAAWVDEAERAKWLRKRDFEPMAATTPHAVSGIWCRDESRLEISIEEVEEGRCRLTVRHCKLRDLETAETMQKFWKTAIERLVVKAL